MRITYWGIILANNVLKKLPRDQPWGKYDLTNLNLFYLTRNMH
jgi:hypothetical protein